MRGESARLQDMLDAIAALRRHRAGGRAAYDRDELVRVWVIHHLQIIGEATGIAHQVEDTQYFTKPIFFASH